MSYWGGGIAAMDSHPIQVEITILIVHECKFKQCKLLVGSGLRVWLCGEPVPSFNFSFEQSDININQIIVTCPEVTSGIKQVKFAVITSLTDMTCIAPVRSTPTLTDTFGNDNLVSLLQESKNNGSYFQSFFLAGMSTPVRNSGVSKITKCLQGGS